MSFCTDFWVKFFHKCNIYHKYKYITRPYPRDTSVRVFAEKHSDDFPEDDLNLSRGFLPMSSRYDTHTSVSIAVHVQCTTWLDLYPDRKFIEKRAYRLRQSYFQSLPQ